MKNILVPLGCLLFGAAMGYGLRAVSEGPGERLVTSAASANKETKGPSAVPAGVSSAPPSAGVSSPAAAGAPVSLSDQMKDLLVDYDVRSARKAASRLSATELQAALALTAAMPKSPDRDSLRQQLYRAWAALDPNAAWQAALADPLDKGKGYLPGVVAGEIVKTKPQVAIDLAQRLEMGERRGTVMRAVFTEWGGIDVAAAMAYALAHPDLGVDPFSFSRGISELGERDPLKAGSLVLKFTDSMKRGILLGTLMGSWVERDPPAAMQWAQSQENPSLKTEAIAAAIAAWAKADPAAALNYARALPDADTRNTALEKGWRDWFGKSPQAATDYLSAAGNEKLLESSAFHFAYASEGFTAKERADLLARLPESAGKQKILRAITDSQIRKGQYNQALELLNAMPDSSGRDRNVQNLGEEWAKADIAGATQWLKIQPDSSDRDLALAGFTRTLARTDPPAALEWLKTVPDATVRIGAMKNIAVRWLMNDPEKAEAWISGVTEFTEVDKKMIRDMAARRFDSIGLSVRVGNRR